MSHHLILMKIKKPSHFIITIVAMEDINQQDDEERVLNVSDDDKEGI